MEHNLDGLAQNEQKDIQSGGEELLIGLVQTSIICFSCWIWQFMVLGSYCLYLPIYRSLIGLTFSNKFDRNLFFLIVG